MTHRHMTEFTGLDFEMTIHEHYFEVLDVIEQLFTYMFDGLHKRWGKQRSLKSTYSSGQQHGYIEIAIGMCFTWQACAAYLEINAVLFVWGSGSLVGLKHAASV